MKRNKPVSLKRMPWYFKILGFHYTFEVNVLSDPEPDGEMWVYRCKLTKLYLRWLGIKLKTYNYEGRKDKYYVKSNTST